MALVLASLTAFCLYATGLPADTPQQGKADFLHIGSCASLALDASGGKEDVAIDNLKSFIKSETGFDSDILRQKTWSDVADKLAKKEIELGVFQGIEFAWAHHKYPNLRPLALAVNGDSYRFASVLARKDDKATDFAGLRGRTIALPAVGQSQLRVFVDRLSQAQGKAPEAFFSKITSPENIEDTLDDLADGMVQAAAVDRVGLEAYKRRKPGRFARLKVIAESSAFPPPLIAYLDQALAKAKLDRFQEGLLNARQKEGGQRLLTLFKLTGFEKVPANFNEVVAAVQKEYPRPKSEAK